MKSWLCNNCGHTHEATEQLTELSFKWLDEHTTKVSCANCGTYTIQRAHTYDAKGYPIAGEFFVVRTCNKIRKGRLT